MKVWCEWLRAARKNNFRQDVLSDLTELSALLTWREDKVGGLDLRGLSALFGNDTTDLGAALALGYNLLRLGYTEQAPGLLRKRVGRQLATLGPQDSGPLECTWGANTFRLSMADEAGTYLDVRVGDQSFVPVANLGDGCRLLTTLEDLPALHPDDATDFAALVNYELMTLRERHETGHGETGTSLRAAWHELHVGCMHALDALPRVGPVAERLALQARTRNRKFFNDIEHEAMVSELRAAVSAAVSPLMTPAPDQVDRLTSSLTKRINAERHAQLDEEASRLRLERQRALPHAERAVRQAETAFRSLLQTLRRRSRQLWWWFTPGATLLESVELCRQLYGALFECESLRLGNALLDVLIENVEQQGSSELARRQGDEKRLALLLKIAEALHPAAGAKAESEQAATHDPMSACERTPSEPSAMPAR